MTKLASESVRVLQSKPRLRRQEKSNEELKSTLIESVESSKEKNQHSRSSNESESVKDFSDNEEYVLYPERGLSRDCVTDQRQCVNDIRPLLDLNLKEEDVGVESGDLFEFIPNEIEQELLVPPANPIIEYQGIQRLRLDQSSYNKIRYSDIELQAFPLFNALHTNK